MSKWEMVRLGDVCEKGSSNIAQKDLENNFGDYPIYGAAGLIKYVDFYKQLDEYIAIVKDGAGIGRTTLMPARSSVIGTMQYILPTKAIDIKYLYFAIIHMNLAKYFTGATIPHIYFKDYCKEQLPLPPLDEQKRIAKNLDLASEIVKGYKEQLAELDKLVQSVFYEMFGDPSDNPHRYTIIKFVDCVEYMGDIGSNGANSVVSSNLKMKDEKDYALMVRFLNFTKNDFKKDVKYVSKETYDFFKKSKIYGGEIIFCKIGSAGLNYIMPKLDIPVSLGLNQIMVRLETNVELKYIYNYLNTDFGKSLISKCVQGAVTKSITKGSLKLIPIMLPPLTLQTRFASIVTEIEAQKKLVKQALTEAENLFNSLTQEYFE